VEPTWPPKTFDLPRQKRLPYRDSTVRRRSTAADLQQRISSIKANDNSDTVFVRHVFSAAIFSIHLVGQNGVRKAGTADDERWGMVLKEREKQPSPHPLFATMLRLWPFTCPRHSYVARFICRQLCKFVRQDAGGEIHPEGTGTIYRGRYGKRKAETKEFQMADLKVAATSR